MRDFGKGASNLLGLQAKKGVGAALVLMLKSTSWAKRDTQTPWTPAHYWCTTIKHGVYNKFVVGGKSNSALLDLTSWIVSMILLSCRMVPVDFNFHHIYWIKRV